MLATNRAHRTLTALARAIPLQTGGGGNFSVANARCTAGRASTRCK